MPFWVYRVANTSTYNSNRELRQARVGFANLGACSSRRITSIYPSFDSSSKRARQPPPTTTPCFVGDRRRRELGCKSSGPRSRRPAPRRAAPRKIFLLRDGQDKIFAGHKKSPGVRATKRTCGHRGRGHLRL